MKTEQGPPNTDTTSTTLDNKPKTLDVDLMTFAHHLDNSDLNDDEKQEYLGIFWNLVMAFVDLGYGLNATQLACGHLSKTFEKEGMLSADSLHLEQSNRQAEEGVRS